MQSLWVDDDRAVCVLRAELQPTIAKDQGAASPMGALFHFTRHARIKKKYSRYLALALVAAPKLYA